MNDFFNDEPDVFKIETSTTASRQSHVFAVLLPVVSRTRVAVTIENARSATMGELSAIETVGLRIPSGPMVCLGIFIAALAYSFTGCLGTASPPIPHMATKNMNNNMEGVGDSHYLFQYAIRNGGKFENVENDRDDIGDAIIQSKNQRGTIEDLSLENLLKQKFVLKDESTKNKKKVEIDKQNNFLNEKDDDVDLDSKDSGTSTLASIELRMKDDRNVEKMDTKDSNLNVVQNVKATDDQEPVSYYDISPFSSNSSTPDEVQATSSKAPSYDTKYKNDLHETKTVPLNNLIVNSHVKIETEVPYKESSKVKRDSSFVTHYNPQNALSPKISDATESSNTVLDSISKTEEMGKESDTLKRLIQNTVMRLETSLEDVYNRELKSEILNFLDIGDDSNASSDVYSRNESQSFTDLPNNDDSNDNINEQDSDVSSTDEPVEDEDDFNFYMDHLRDVYNDHATYAILRAVETQTIPEDLEFWRMVSKFLDTPAYLKRSRRSARGKRWRSRRYRAWQARRRQSLRARMSITYSHVVPCALRDRFYCINGGTCVFVEALDIKTCRCPIGYTGVRCELIDREYILSLLTNQLIFS